MHCYIILLKSIQRHRQQMKRTIDPCQTGWQSFDPRADIGLLTIYQSISQHTDSMRTIYRPHQFPIKTLPQHLYSQRRDLTDGSEPSVNIQRVESKFMGNRLNLKERMKRFLINNGRLSNRNSIERQKTHEKIKVEQKPIKIQQFSFDQREEGVRVNKKVENDAKKQNILTQISEGQVRNKRRILSVKDELEKIIKMRRENKRYERSSKTRNQTQIDSFQKQKSSRRMLIGSKEHLHQQKQAQLQQKQRYVSLEPHHSLQHSIEQQNRQDYKNASKYLDCAIINLGEEQKMLGQQIRRKRDQKKAKSEIKRPIGPLGREWRKGREIYRSNLLLDFEERPPRTNFTEFRAITPDHQVNKFKEFIREFLNASKISSLQKNLETLEKSP